VNRLSLQLDLDPDPGDLFSTMNVLTRAAGVGAALDDAVDAWITLIKPLYDDTLASFVNAELWKYTPGTFDSSFVSAYDIGVAGTDTGSVNPASQGILTFRTIGGGILRLDFLEINLQPATTDAPPFVNATVTAIAAFVVSVNNWLYARDNTYPIAARAWFAGVNEALFKKIYRP